MRRTLKFSVALLAIVFVFGAMSRVQAATGSQLVTQYSCLGCHSPIPTASTNAATYSLIYNAINGGLMNGISSLKALTTADIQAIADYLVPPPAPAACTDYTYSAWSACDVSGQQTRTVTGNLPAGCAGTPSTAAVLTQACTPTPAACTDYTYSAWSACGSNSQQTRTVTGNLPAGCTGTPSVAAVLTQACTYVPPTPGACNYTYSAWSACQSDNTQARTVVSSSPAGCTGTPVVTQACNYVPPTTPPPATSMAVPSGHQSFTYAPVDVPVLSNDPAQAKPIGVGSVATGGNTLDVRVDIGPFDGPVDATLTVYAPAVDSDDLFFVDSHDQWKSISEAVREDEDEARTTAESNGNRGDALRPMKQFDDRIVWKNTTTGINESVLAGSLVNVPRELSGVYTVTLVVRSHGNHDNYYRWVTQFIIP